MAKLKSRTAVRGAKAAPTNSLVDTSMGPAQTLANCTNAIEFMRQAGLDGYSEEWEHGRYLLLGVINDALRHAENEVTSNAVSAGGAGHEH